MLLTTISRGGLGSQTSRGKNIKAAGRGPFDHGSVASEARGACNGWGPGARLRAPMGVQGEKPPEFYAVLGVGERGVSGDFLKQKS